MQVCGYPNKNLACFILFLVVFFIFPLFLQAQVYPFKIFTVGSGLPSNTVSNLFQDHFGYIWFATDNGACRYNGINFVTFSIQEGLAGSNVRFILEDQKNRIWFGTTNGLSCFDGTNFITYNKANGLPSDHISSGLCSSDGILWFGTDEGLCRYDGTSFTLYGASYGLPVGRIWSIIEDNNKAIWIGLRDGGFAQFNGSKFISYSQKDGLLDTRIFGLAKDPRGGIWIATSGGLCFFDGKTFHPYTVADGLANNLTGNVLVDRYNRVWCTTFGGGLCRFENKKFITFNHNNGLPDNYLTSIIEDYEGNIWCGAKNGVFRLSSDQFSLYTSSIIGQGGVSSMSKAIDGSIWFSLLGGGLTSIDKANRIRRYGVKDGLVSEGIWAICANSKNQIWASDSSGIYLFNRYKFKYFTNEYLGIKERITSIIEDKNHNMWFGAGTAANGKILVYDGKKFKYFTKQDGVVSTQVRSFSLDRSGNLWISCEEGISCFDGKKFISYTKKDGLPSSSIRCFFEDTYGGFWIGTDSGLCKLRNGIFKTYTVNDGLSGNVVRAITSSRDSLWVSTSQGISSFNGEHFKTYTIKDDLFENCVLTNACLQQDENTIWFGTNEGAIRYCSVPEIAHPSVPRICISQVYIEGDPLYPIQVQANYGPALPQALLYNQNNITFEFVGLSFTKENLIKYSFMLEGFDKDWSIPSTQNVARFTNLPSGQYKFLVKAMSAFGLWSEARSITINISPPIWQTLWFRSLYITFLAVIVYSFYSWRVQIAGQRQKDKAQALNIAQEQKLASLLQLLESICVINSKLDLTTVLQNIAEESAHLIGGEPGGIGLVEGNQVVFKRLWSEDHWEDTVVTFYWGEGVAGKIAQTATSMVVNNTESLNGFSEEIRHYYRNGLIGVPIISRTEKVVGVLEVRCREGQASFTESDCQLVESLAHQAAVAIENAELYGELGKKNLMIETSLNELEKLYVKEQEVTRTLQDLNQMKTNFMIVISHEMRTPLTVLKGYVEALRWELFGPLNSSQQHSMKSCQDMIDRMVTNVEDIQEMLRINEGYMFLKPTKVNLSELVKKAVGDLSPFIDHRKQSIAIKSPELLNIYVDSEKIQLVLLNVIQNAIKFTPDGGLINILVKSENNSVHIVISDNGIGIELNEITRIFEKFYTSLDTSRHMSGQFEFSARGTGLGLAIAKSYVEAHNGSIWAESPGTNMGSSFHIILPLNKKVES